MALCLVTAGKTLAIAASAFSLSWVHSVEKTEWQENWEVSGQMLVLRQARVKGSGAGMDPGDGARLVDGWWVWQPDTPPVEELNLAASGETVSGWKLCHEDAGHDKAEKCLELGTRKADTIRLAVCGNNDG